MLAGYDHLLRAARRLQWDAEAVALDEDAARVHGLRGDDPGAVARLTALVAGFVLAERAVAEHLEPWVTAAAVVDADPAARECFAVQAADERRHARFFARVADEVLGGVGPDDAPEGIRELFGDELPAMAAGLAGDVSRLGPAVGLYHLVLEGIAFAVGQEALHALCGELGLAGTAAGVARVQGDERWHVGLGVLALTRLGADVDVAEPAARAIAAWGPSVATPARTARVLAAHRRRCAIARPDGAVAAGPLR